MTLQAEISEEKNSRFVGRELDLVVEGIDEEGEVLGRTFGQAPEVDGFTRLEGFGEEEVIPVGEFVRGRVTGSDIYDLTARLIDT